MDIRGTAQVSGIKDIVTHCRRIDRGARPGGSALPFAKDIAQAGIQKMAIHRPKLDGVFQQAFHRMQARPVVLDGTSDMHNPVNPGKRQYAAAQGQLGGYF